MPGVNFINILRAHFALIFWRQKILYPNHSFVIFGAKILYKKCMSKVLMKLFPGVNFTNILQAAFSRFFFWLQSLYFFVERKLAQKLFVKMWNLLQVGSEHHMRNISRL